MGLSAIGQFEFINISAPPSGLRQDVEVVTRQGIDGVAAWLTGLHGRPETFRSKVDARTVAHAHELYDAYCGIIGTIVDVQWASVATSGRGFSCLVKDVRSPRIIKLAGHSGTGVNPPSGAWLECEWELVPVGAQTTEQSA